MFTCAGKLASLMSRLGNWHRELMLLNTDVDECVDSNGGCAHVCNNTVGSLSCGCNEGYLLNSDEINCDGK